MTAVLQSATAENIPLGTCEMLLEIIW